MRKFWGLYDNGMFQVGCNGATVYIYDAAGKELDRIKELPYTYSAAFFPSKNIIALKSTDGYLGFYDLEQLKLLQKYRVSTAGGQDEGFAFSPDGSLFYNIEKPHASLRTQLAIYETKFFQRTKTLFSTEMKMVLDCLEFDEQTNLCYVLGFMRNSNNGVLDYGFIGLLDSKNETIAQLRRISPLQTESGINMDYPYIQAYKHWEAQGFTEKSFEWSWFHYHRIDSPAPISLREIYHLL